MGHVMFPETPTLPVSPDMFGDEPSMPAAPPTGGREGMSKFSKILQLVVPAIATAYALKKGSGLGEFMDSYQHGQQQDFENQDRLKQRQLQEEDYRRRIAEAATQEARQHRIEAAQIQRFAEERQHEQQQQQALKEKTIHDSIQRAVDKATENPGFMDKVNKGGAENFALTVPGVGNITLAEAFDRLGVVHGEDGSYSYGKPEPIGDLVPVPGPGGKPVYGKKQAGAAVYERPRAEPKPEKGPAKRTYTWKDDDPNSDTWGQSFRITEDADGNEISRRPLTGTPKPVPSHGPGGGSPSKVKILSITPIP